MTENNVGFQWPEFVLLCVIAACSIAALLAVAQLRDDVRSVRTCATVRGHKTCWIQVAPPTTEKP